MSKVMGIIFTLVGFLITLYTSFLVLNTNVYLPYNPADKSVGMGDVGLILPFIFGVFFFVTGVTLLIISKVDNSETRC